MEAGHNVHCVIQDTSGGPAALGRDFSSCALQKDAVLQYQVSQKGNKMVQGFEERHLHGPTSSQVVVDPHLSSAPIVILVSILSVFIND